MSKSEFDQVIHEKFINIQNLMYLLGEQNFRNGFPYYNQNYRKRRLLFNPIIKNSLYVLYLTIDFISYYITEDYYAVLIGDWYHNYPFKFQMSLAMIIAIVMNVSLDSVNHFSIKDNKTMKLFISNEYNERIPTANKMKHIFRSIERLYIYSVYFNAFSMGCVFLLRYYSLGQLMTYGLFWAFIFAQFAIFLATHFFWNVLFFISFCLYSKQLLKCENNRLQSYMDSGLNNSWRVFPMALRRFDAIHYIISKFNEIWSQFLLISIFGGGAVKGVFTFQAFSSKIPNIYLRFCYLFFVAILVLFVTPIVIFCSSVESEAKRSHKLLTKLNARRDLKISLRIRIKVCIELNSNYLLINCFLSNS